MFYVCLLLKVTGSHLLSHHADDVDVEHCQVRHRTTAFNFSLLLEIQPVVVPPTEFYIWEPTISISPLGVVLNQRH
ncbi:hypothetical protein [Maribacter ulvicola]|uniref:Uncharacterized protein n=1 Tax=Maribacter ulvicola TaxID=228959 RepID=A0A1N6UFM8_9FLAO|nr:hypothetical protein [Maribacter ulvicola]SIQ64116.1 hypothetical protein SAMN05421797_102317 [Maribacter ulvicola]